MRSLKSTRGLAIAIATAFVLPACGGGDDPQPPPAASLDVTVIDGPIEGAIVCVDSNRDGACSSGEPSATTDATGKASLPVTAAQQSGSPIVAVVGTNAKNAGAPVDVAFTLSAPADKPAVVTPLTTLVHARSDAAGESSADAEAFVKAQTGLQGSLFSDFSSSDPAAASVARVAVLTMQAKNATLQSAVGQTDATGATVSQADVHQVVNQSLLEQLSELGAVATDPAIGQAADKEVALKARAQEISSQSPITPTEAVATVGTERLISQGAGPNETTGANASLRMLRFGSPTDWFYRALLVSAANAVPDTSGRTGYTDLRRRNQGGTLTTWSYGSSPESEDDLHWNGTAWSACTLATRNTSTAASGGVSTYDYCDGYSVGTSRRSDVDIGGKTMASVIADIRKLPGTEAGVAYASFGPADLAVLGSATFPTGSRLQYRQNVERQNAFAYTPGTGISVVVPAVAAGGDARNGATPPCGAITATTPVETWTTTATSLEGAIAANQGTPCRFAPSTNANGSSGDTNEWWSQSTLGIGSVPNGAVRPAGSGNYYQTTLGLRIGFAASGNGVTYYSCLLRTGDSSARNCKVIGSGTYKITSLGDARVLAVTNPPGAAAALALQRVLVQRGGAVYAGYQVKPTTRYVAGLNLTATNALFQTIGLSPLNP